MNSDVQYKLGPTLLDNFVALCQKYSRSRYYAHVAFSQNKGVSLHYYKLTGLDGNFRATGFVQP